MKDKFTTIFHKESWGPLSARSLRGPIETVCFLLLFSNLAKNFIQSLIPQISCKLRRKTWHRHNTEEI